MGDNIEILAKSLISAIEINMNPTVSQQDRTNAYLVCEEFKAKSPYCAQCGLHLCKIGHSPVVRHFGLQLLEHCIKFRWNSMKVQEKTFIKNNVLDQVAKGTEGIVNEHSHIKGALARIVVEIIKREWPQQWPTLLEELHFLCTLGETQTELVLLIFLALAEDTVILQTYLPQRRKEIYRTLNMGLSEIFPFFLNTLKTQLLQYQTALKQNDMESQQVHGRLVETVLLTLGNGYLEWCSMVHLSEDNYNLLPVLCFLLTDEKFQLPAAECLIALTSRKLKPEEGAAYFVLLQDENLNLICSTARNCIDHQSSVPHQEAVYTFLKRLCLVYTGLGNQIISFWDEIGEWITTSTFQKYIRTLLAFTEHASKLLSSYSCGLWLNIIQHPVISSNEEVKACMPLLLEACSLKLVKFGYPSRNDSPSCAFSRIDFDSDDDFHNFISKYRLEVTDIVKAITVQNPTLAFNYASKWIQIQVTRPLDLGQGNENGCCQFSSPSFLEWDALASFSDSVFCKIMLPSQLPKPSPAEGIAILKSILQYETEDPLILSCVLTCISGLFVFLSEDTECLPTVLKKIFSVVVFTIPGWTKATRPKPVKNVRRHACSSLIKICKQYPRLLLPAFDEIYNHVQRLCIDPEELSKMEKCTLYEVLVLLSNEFHDYEKQATFLKEIISPVQKTWLQLRETFLSEKQFMSAIGLNSAPVEPSTDDYKGILRSQLHFCLDFLLGVMKRSVWPEDTDTARSGHFLMESNVCGETYRNPVTPSVLPALEPLLCLIRVLNRICTPEYLSCLHPEFSCALGMTELDKNNVIGSSSPSTDLNADKNYVKKPWERMQMFITNIFDVSFHILGNAGVTMRVEFYSFPNLSDDILHSVFDHLEFQTDFRLRTILRVFIKPFIQHCPHQLTESTVVPILGALCPFMLKKLSVKWQAFNLRYGFSSGYEDEMTESQEILEDKLNRILTREYIDLLGTTMSSLKRPLQQQNLDSMDDDSEATVSNASYDKLSELGRQLLSKESLCATLVATLFSALNWDSVACVKSAHLCWPTIKKLAAEDIIQSEQEAVYLIQSVLQGLQRFGEHDANRAVLLQLGTQVYELLRPKFAGLATMLQQSSGCSLRNIEEFDHVILSDKPVSDKKKRDLFKLLVRGAIGDHVSTQFKEVVEIKNLAPILGFFRRKNKNIDMLETEEEAGLSSFFSN